MSHRLGYVGIGDMGGAMARCIVDAGLDLRVNDLSAEAVDALVERGASAAGTAAALAAECDHVSICVPAAEHVRAVLTGDDGLLAGAHDGLSVAVHSTIEPDVVRELSTLAAESGVILFDAGVAGGAIRAENGELAITVGVPEAGVPAAARAALDTCGGLVVECGPVGSGCATKVAANVMTYLQFAALSTAYDVARGGGGDPTVLLEVWRHVGMLGDLAEQFSSLMGMSREDKDAPGFAPYLRQTIGLAEKDLGIAAALAAAVDRDPVLLETTAATMYDTYGMTPPA